MLAAIRTMLTSKRFISGVAGLVVAAALKLGLELDTASVAAVITPIVAYIISQGMADWGKEA